MDFTNRYKSLNAAQREAVDTIDGPVRVIAGPGTGKTELLSMRAATILKKTDVLAENILCLTFTDSGASAMRGRLTQVIGPEAYKIAIHTFHSFGADIMSQYGEYFYQGAHFRAADELSSYELLHSILDGLDHQNPLASKMNGEYTHLNDILSSISELKRSGLTSDELLMVLDANDEVIDRCEPLLREVFTDRISKATARKVSDILPLIHMDEDHIALPAITPLSEVLADSLEAALSEAAVSDSTKPITAWRDKWMKRDDTNSFVLTSRSRQKKLRALSGVYYQYLDRMQQSELYDFDDMILRVVHAMEVFPELRFNLQEKYQYIMVDEFQDTNMAQMRILYNLTNNEVLNGQPNLMVVGDDDQAIYSFQGADVGNIHYFEELFPSAPLIVLTENYRSAAPILSQARRVIVQGDDRLETRHPDITKELIAKKDARGSSVTFIELADKSDERSWIVEAIAKDIQKGTPADSITILARRHHEIVALLPYFSQLDIAVSYERRDNVLDNELIVLLEHLGNIITALFEQRHEDANAGLPELLSHPAFGIAPLTLWKLSLSARANHISWMETMAVTPELLSLHRWLIEQAAAVPIVSLETLLDCIIGTNQPPDSSYVSPLYDYFFAADKLEASPQTYILFLEALRTIRSKLREYQPEIEPSLLTFIEFIRLCRQRGATITSVRSAHTPDSNTINLMTAHKSKGLEFDTVYIIGGVDSSWGERVKSRNRLITYPENLKLSPAGDSVDERMRLFYVAMTRAKRRLIISSSRQDDNGKSLLPASFISQMPWEYIEPATRTIQAQTKQALIEWYLPVLSPIQPSMHDVLRPTLEGYKLSVTHLNNFLDVSRGGPHMFLMQNLLHFPQAISPSAAYGTAIHSALQRAHSHLTATKSHRPAEDILRDFEDSLRQQHLSPHDFEHYLQKGSDTLTAFLQQKYSTFTPQQKVEVSFAHQAVFVGKAHLTGSLDMIDIHDGAISVTDYKTGKASRTWTGKTDFEKIKLHKYKQQLMFYELLLQNSRDYSRYEIDGRYLQFVEPTQSGDIVHLDASFTPEECEHFSRLIEAVWKHITTLELPDTSNFESNYKGMLAFESWLLDERG